MTHTIDFSESRNEELRGQLFDMKQNLASQKTYADLKCKRKFVNSSILLCYARESMRQIRGKRATPVGTTIPWRGQNLYFPSLHPSTPKKYDSGYPLYKFCYTKARNLPVIIASACTSLVLFVPFVSLVPQIKFFMCSTSMP